MKDKRNRHGWCPKSFRKKMDEIYMFTPPSFNVSLINFMLVSYLVGMRCIILYGSHSDFGALLCIGPIVILVPVPHFWYHQFDTTYFISFFYGPILSLLDQSKWTVFKIPTAIRLVYFILCIKLFRSTNLQEARDTKTT